MSEVEIAVAGEDSAGVRIPPPVIFAAGFAAGLGLQAVARLWAPGGPAVIAGGALLIAVGSAFAISSVLLFRRAGTSLDPAGPTQALVSSGPYRVSRNPIYLGFTLLYAGIALAAGVAGPLVTLPAVLIAVDRYVIGSEESYLTRSFGADYERYRASVRRWL